jgi:hypothetical protein
MAGGQVLVCLLIWLRLELARQAASGIHRAWPIYSINTVACKDHTLEPTVLLHGGMLVLLQVNLDIKGGLFNGSQGIVCGFEEFDLKMFCI